VTTEPLDPAAIITDDELISRMMAAPMFDAGSEEWFLRIGRSVERLVRDRLGAELAAERDKVRRLEVMCRDAYAGYQRLRPAAVMAVLLGVPEETLTPPTATSSSDAQVVTFADPSGTALAGEGSADHPTGGAA
jgi:hypothetical protein